MSETKTFKTLSVATITTGIVMVDKFEGVQECMSWVLGHEIWTHEMPRVSKQAVAAILAQHPAMPTECKPDWKDTAAEVLAAFGPTVALSKGDTARTLDPLTTLRMAVGDDTKIIAVGTQEQTP